ncbi:chorismate lyase [Massilia sp. R2A-15]|uniref:chorismate--pyruvate lyase family protein n=1 Tax=Massilia sp. R2A-15 TaxID=3064278 RepID=UPI0027338B4E|nr:chorismate lyase [Massilia sp. R2A-15]WLI88411.1 chorismate lyase [Massilia sp. R2A-15]
MRPGSLRQARWHRHVNAVAPTDAMRAWLTEGGSLTARLMRHSAAFRVQKLHQRSALCLSDEAQKIGMARPGRVWEREVLLRCDGEPVVFAHTVVPLSASASDWPLFGHLGERSLGSTLFYDPLVRRGELEFARLRAGHPLVQRAHAALGGAEDTIYYARRCLYRRHQGTLLVTEVFLPSVINLIAAPTLKNVK